MQKSLFEKLVLAHLVNKFPTFYGRRNFIIVFINSQPLVPILSQINPVSWPPFFTPLSILILLSNLTPISSKWFLIYYVEWLHDSQFQVYFIMNSKTLFHSLKLPAGIFNLRWLRPAVFIKNVFILLYKKHDHIDFIYCFLFGCATCFVCLF